MLRLLYRKNVDQVLIDLRSGHLLRIIEKLTDWNASARDRVIDLFFVVKRIHFLFSFVLIDAVLPSTLVCERITA